MSTSAAADQDRTRTNTSTAGRVLLTAALVATPAALAIFLFNADHAFNSQWHPHARFHGVQLAGFGITMSLLGLWLLWRRSAQPWVNAATGAATVLLLWIAEFYAFAVPGTGPAPDPDEPNTIDLLGATIYGNLLFAGLMVGLAAIGYGLILRRGRLADGSAGGRTR
ncbi:DUF6640 family protein [Glycomyces xiaoerkulensis]|uniref:DUF6640 family protein n=1 Tax=Glycomyces xiaoerkulensis TaxID=2038139 RepID=UPI000C255FA8|nr:DUF6640 family protein [Glycomyces xiaoerkulensis]